MAERKTAADSGTRARILDVAEKLFADKGFSGVTVREITEKAGCNLASVNYHFGNKEKLYLAVFDELWVPRTRKIQESIYEYIEKEMQGEVDPHEVMAAAIAYAFIVKGFHSDEERRRHVLLIIREMADPGTAFEHLATTALQPMFNKAAEAILMFHPNKGLSPEKAMLMVLSIMGQAIYFTLGRSMISRLLGREFDKTFTETLFQHVSTFSLDGIRGLIGKEIK